MSNLWILVKMQLRERLDFKRFSLKNVNLFHILLSTLWAVLKFLLVGALCYVFLQVAILLHVFGQSQVIPTKAISFVFSVMLAASVLSCTIGLTKSMYYAQDNAILLTLPCRPIQVYLSKLIIFFIFELKRNLSFIVPLFIAYYVVHGYAVGYYLWLLFSIVLVSLFTVAIGSLLSIPGMWLCNLFRQRKSLQIATLAAVVSAATLLLFYGISLIPANVDIVAKWGTISTQIDGFLTSYAVGFSWLYDITLLVLGEFQQNFVPVLPLVPTLLRLLTLLLITALCLAGSLLIVLPLFYKMASKPFEHLKRRVKARKNHVHSRPVAVVYTEWLISTKSANRIFANVGMLLSIPMLSYFLNKIFLAMNTRELGNQMVVAFNVLIILLITLNANCYASSIFSRDGRSSYLIKTQPSKYLPLLLAKLIPNTAFMLLSLAATFVILLTTASLGTANTVMLMVAIFAIYLAHLLYCAELDLMNPQTELYATVGSSESNPNETKATVSAFLIAFGIAAALFLLLYEAGANVYLKFIGVALAAFAYRAWMFADKVKLYYKEK